MATIRLILLSLVFVECFVKSHAFAESNYKITPDVVYGHKAGMALTFDVVRPKEPNGVGVMFMVSGGWFSPWVPPESVVSDNPLFQFRVFRQIVDHGYTLFLVRHGSAPQFKVPEAVDDVRRAVRYIRLHAKDYEIDPERLGVCGGSAGGHLSLMLGTASDKGNTRSKDEVERVSNRVAAVAVYYPPVDMREWVGKLTDQFPALDFDPKLAESISPIVHVSKDDPPTLLVHGDKDNLVKLDNSQRMESALKKAGVTCKLIVMPGAAHGFGMAQDRQASKAVLEWFDAHLLKADQATKD
ncbi:MAG: alpha/beta hydrolase [Pirellulales bacterium]|nr:alpha/beta hydrolase [Pirellulales bacterium]